VRHSIEELMRMGVKAVGKLGALAMK